MKSKTIEVKQTLYTVEFTKAEMEDLLRLTGSVYIRDGQLGIDPTSLPCTSVLNDRKVNVHEIRQTSDRLFAHLRAMYQATEGEGDVSGDVK